VRARAGAQSFILALGLALFSAIGQASLLALVCAYLLALVICELPPFRRWLASLRAPVRLFLAALLCVPGISFVYRERAHLLREENVVGFAAALSDRLRLEAAPAIAPPLLSTDRPQTFFVSAPGARRVGVRWSPGLSALETAAIGGGLFRLDYDPRRDGVPPPGASVQATLLVDGDPVERSLRLVTPSAHPRWFCSAPDRSAAATPSEETDELIVYGAGELTRIAVGDGPVDCAFLDSDQIAVSHRYDGRLWLLDRRGIGSIAHLGFDAPLGRLALSPDRSRLAVARLGREPGLCVLEGAGWSERTCLPLKAASDELVFGKDADQLIAATRTDAALHLFVRTSSGWHESRVQRLGRPVVTLARARDGRHIFVATTDYRPDGQPQLGNHFVQDQLLTFDTSTLALTARALTARRSERQSKPGDVDQGGSPMGIVQLDDDELAVTFAGSDELWRIQADGQVSRAIDLGKWGLYTPHGVAALADGKLLVSSPAAGVLGIWRDDGWTGPPQLVQLAPAEAWLHAHDEPALLRRQGERGFFETTRSGISCQSCHMHADSDGSGYNLGDHRLVPTLTVQGLLGTAPYLRDGSYPRIQDLDEVAQTLYRGYLRDQPGRRRRLDAYVEGLPRPAAWPSRDRSSERRGYAVFRKAQCARCHPPPAFTSLGQLPLIALFPSLASEFPPNEVLDVPSLLSVSSSAPYLNDGRASTLRAVIDDYNPDDRHGDTRGLSQAERADLVAFLESL
jgi:hypothetical protein